VLNKKVMDKRCCTYEQEQTILANKDYCMKNLATVMKKSNVTFHFQEQMPNSHAVTGTKHIFFLPESASSKASQTCVKGDRVITSNAAEIEASCHDAEKTSEESLSLFNSPERQRLGFLLTETEDVHQPLCLHSDKENTSGDGESNVIRKAKFQDWLAMSTRWQDWLFKARELNRKSANTPILLGREWLDRQEAVIDKKCYIRVKEGVEQEEDGQMTHSFESKDTNAEEEKLFPVGKIINLTVHCSDWFNSHSFIYLQYSTSQCGEHSELSNQYHGGSRI
jgi:hypothetical protein